METKKMQKGIITIALPVWAHNLLNKVSFAKMRVPKGTFTDTHYHKFVSLYLVENMYSLKLDGGELKMPRLALVIVLPFVNHTWSNMFGTSSECYVGDLSPSHGEHLIQT
jgi:hypothetical protein